MIPYLKRNREGARRTLLDCGVLWCPQPLIAAQMLRRLCEKGVSFVKGNPAFTRTSPWRQTDTRLQTGLQTGHKRTSAKQHWDVGRAVSRPPAACAVSNTSALVLGGWLPKYISNYIYLPHACELACQAQYSHICGSK